MPSQWLQRVPSPQSSQSSSGRDPSPDLWFDLSQLAGKREGINLNGFQDFRTENGSIQSQNLAVAGLFVQGSLHSGFPLAVNWDLDIVTRV